MNVSQIIKHLKKTMDVELIGHDVVISGIALPGKAVPGNMSWSRTTHALFEGSLLFCGNYPENRYDGKTYIVCDNPKLAFILTTSEFFPTFTETIWPYDNIHSSITLHPSFRILKSVAIGSNTRVGANVIIGPNTSIANALIADNVRIGVNCAIGLDGFGFAVAKDGTRYRFPHIGKVVIEENVEIDCGVAIDRGTLTDTILKQGVKIDNHCHVAHDVVLGENVALAPGVTFGGHAVIGDNTWVGLGSNIKNNAVVGKNVLIGMGANVVKDIPDGKVVAGNPARVIRDKNGDDL